MARRTVLGIAIACSVCALLACSSLPDLHFDDGDGGGLEGGAPDAAPFDCKTTGFACQDTVPDWTPVLFAAAAQPACPSGTNGIDLKVAAGDASATCACSCAAVGGSCTSGSYTVASAADGACAVTPATTSLPLNAPGCTAIPSGSIALSTRGMATANGPTTCMADGALSGPLTSGRLCQAAGAGAGCAANQSCAPKAAMGLQACVTKSGRNACPAGFTKRSTAGTSANDARSCTGCTCGAPAPCSGGSVSLYDNQTCKTMGAQSGAEGISNACNALAPSAGFTATHFKATPPTGGGCGAPTSPGTATGSVTFVDERTICCK